MEQLLEAFAAGVREVLAADLVGVYVSGSVVLGDVNPRSSDVDVLVVSENRPDAATVTRLAALHRELASRYEWGGRLEGAYTARSQLRPWGIEGPVAAIAPGRELETVAAAEHGPSNILALRTVGRVLAGAAPGAVFPEVDAPTLERGVRGYVDELACAGVEEGAAGRSLRVLDLARSLYTLAHRRPVSK
nr:nucleotidyltransferase domain-containing protein [Actinomycetota bacterium]